MCVFFLLEKMKNCDGLNSNFLKDMSLHDVRLDSDSFYGYGFGAPMYGCTGYGTLNGYGGATATGYTGYGGNGYGKWVCGVLYIYLFIP